VALHKKVAKHIQYQAIKFLAKLLYITGLTFLIPLVPIVFSESGLASARYVFAIALALVIASFFAIYVFTRSKRVAFAELGYITLIPGLLAVIFAYIGPRRIALLVSFFRELSPLIQEWINNSIPKSWFLSGIYIILGVFLIWLSEQVNH